MSKNFRAPDCPRRSNCSWPRTLLPLVGLLGWACTFEHTLVVVPQPPGQLQIYQNHNLLPPVSAFCANLQWLTCSRPEFTDDQAFMGADKQTYGPPAFIAPAQDLDSHTSDQDFQAGAVLVGYVFVSQDAASLPSTYTDLKLNYGNNCVYLRHDSGAFKAYVVPQTTTCGLYTPIPAHQLNVLAISPPDYPNHSDIPPVARFHEGNKGQSAGVPFFGLKCGNKWCLVVPESQGQTVSEWDAPHKGVHNNRRSWAVYGWNDSQHLALPKQGGGLTRSTMRVSVLAVPNLGDITEAQYTQDFQHVATVYFRGKPSGKYKDAWHYGKGHNEVFLKRIDDQNWQAEIRHTRYILGIPVIINVTSVPVMRRDHGIDMPGTARFLWTDTDEDLWIACDDGCCRVAG